MKKKIRKIVIENNTYLYRTLQKQIRPDLSRFILRVFLEHARSNPLVIEFLVREGYITGNPLNMGVMLFNYKTQGYCYLNMNYPRYVREMILLGLKKGWTGTSLLNVPDGITWLQELGFDTTDLVPVTSG